MPPSSTTKYCRPSPTSTVSTSPTRPGRPGGAGSPRLATTGVASAGPSGSTETNAAVAARGSLPASRNAASTAPLPPSTRCRSPPATSHVESSGPCRKHAVARADGRPRRGVADHGGADQHALGVDRVAHRPTRPDRRLGCDGHRPRHRGSGRARGRGERLVGHDRGGGGAGLATGGRADAQGAEHQPRRRQIGYRYQPVGVVRDRVHRSRRRPDDDGLAPPIRARHDRRPDGRATQPEQPQDHPSQRRPALRPDLLVQRHRIPPDQRGLHPAQAETVGVGLIPGRRSPERARGGHARR